MKNTMQNIWYNLLHATPYNQTLVLPPSSSYQILIQLIFSFKKATVLVWPPSIIDQVQFYQRPKFQGDILPTKFTYEWESEQFQISAFCAMEENTQDDVYLLSPIMTIRSICMSRFLVTPESSCDTDNEPMQGKPCNHPT